MNINLRTARPQDAALLTEIAVRSKKYWGYSDALITAWMPELTVTPEFIDESIGYVVEEEGRIAGFWCRSAREELAEGLLFIEPRDIGKGYGRLLWHSVMTEAQARGLQYLTWLSDPNAAAFYEKMGAKKIGEHASQVVPGRTLPIMRYELSCHTGPLRL